jgi:uncharacterized radical SAM protein YgiQ
MFIPATPEEIAALGWKGLDVILVTGDSYIDSPHIGVAVIGRVLMDAGYRVGIIPQPDMTDDRDISRLGEPELFWGVTGGCMDSMIANYTASRKHRRRDDLTAGGVNNRRPDRAVIAYANLIRRYFKQTKPIVLGGIEASLRRISHYDFWSDAVRRSILFDARADILAYGMAEETILEIAGHLKNKRPAVSDIAGICYIAPQPRPDYLLLPAHSVVAKDKGAFADMFARFSENADPVRANGLCQQQDTRFLIVNPPRLPIAAPALDRIHEFGFHRDAHPIHQAQGPVRALDTLRFSIITHRGCFGDCAFCAIAVHEGRIITDRSEASILREAAALATHADFKGIIQNVGGPTANMYGMGCRRPESSGPCKNKRCLGPSPCRHLDVRHDRQMDLLRRLRRLADVRKVFIGSGIRHDLVLHDARFGREYLEEIIRYHVSGQLKIAPEHCEDHILALMGKPDAATTEKFVALFQRTCRSEGVQSFLTCYLMAAFPGCTLADMRRLKQFTRRVFRFTPEQIQIFTPGPATRGALMYHTGKGPDGKAVFVEKNTKNKEIQKQELVEKPPKKRPASH